MPRRRWLLFALLAVGEPCSIGKIMDICSSTDVEPFLGSEERCDRCVLQDANSFRSTRGGDIQRLCLTSTVLEYTSGARTLFLHLEDVIGAKARPVTRSNRRGKGGGGGEDDEKNQGGFHYQLEIFAYVPGAMDKEPGCAPSVGLCRRGKKKRNPAHQTWLVSDDETARKWETAINDLLKAEQKNEADSSGEGSDAGCADAAVKGNPRGPGRRLLVLINPFSGTGKSRSTWQETLRPMLEQAMASVKVMFSSRRGEFEELIKNAGDAITGGAGGEAGGGGGPGSSGDSTGLGSLDDFDGIIVIGGDGTFFEVLQGMYARPDCARQLARLSLGIVPGGSGNGLAKTLSVESGEEFGVVSASFLAAKGATKPMDLLPTESGSKKYLAFLNVGWGMISDVDIESEAYRWMGSLRFTVGTVVRIVNLKYYRGRISYLPDLQPGQNATAMAPTPFHMPPLTDPVHMAPGDGSDSANTSGEEASAQRWTSVEGDFILADIAQTSHIAHDMPMAPHSRLGDGLMDLFFIKKGASRIEMMQMFLAMEKGEHISPRFPCISWFRVRAFRIEPLTSNGRLTVDGELVDYAPLQQHVWHKAANVFCSP